ncbi:HD domain-containing phosphohydrolase [Pseudomonas sp. NW5]|uniref:HD domain-containing phosphohydrolase n=1 Tax=Pseudomonas sp. NW5 TaxID=2934934 RepID=UPI0020220D39|nr:HD domain-containing phosphohydrolase [Pseudomonas sp. NW5]MCL7461900.1 PilZ domain-containing protein [Pseudomonas sp. NW5]
MSEHPQELLSCQEHPQRCQTLLEDLSLQHDLQLLNIHQPEQPLPVLLSGVQAGQALVLDLTATPGIADMLENLPESFQLAGRSGPALVRTSVLRVRGRMPPDGRIQLRCDWPESLEVLHRRHDFRAELNRRMEVQVSLQLAESDKPLKGRLCDLSLGGCRIQIAATGGANELLAEQVLERIELTFPSGERAVLQGSIRHAQISHDLQSVYFGCAFAELANDQERRLWFYVREIEREASRIAAGGDPQLAPSGLFQRPERSRATELSRQHGLDYVTPMARRLARVAVYLNAQLLRLQQGGEIDPVQLSRQSEFLLGLLEDDREALLFASHCLVDDLPLVQHCIAVAVRLCDLLKVRRMPAEQLKAVAACALVHDLGKALLPPALLRCTRMDEAQRAEFASHVALLRARMSNCTWLPRPVIQGVIYGINERLDGSGYPRGLKAEELSELARAAAVVDVIDAMSRARPDRAARTVTGIYRHLVEQREALDRQWCGQYVRHFGVIPIGALVRFEAGQLGWVQALDAQQRVARVLLSERPSLVGATEAQVVSAEALSRLGRIEGIIVPAEMLP